MRQYLLTGCNGGIGQAIEHRLAGGSLPRPGEPEPTGGAATAAFIHPSETPGVHGVDLADPFRLSLSAYDAVIVAQGWNDPKEPVNAIGTAEWMSNFWEVTQLAQQWVRDKSGMQFAADRKPFIVLVSNSAVIPRTNSLHYCASKAAMDMALKVLHRQYATGGFEFYSLCSGPVAGTPMTERVFKALPEGAMTKAVERLPLGRFAEPREIAEWVAFILTTPAAVLAAGQTLRLDSGEH